MKPLEILSALPALSKAAPSRILDSPAFAMPCRYGEETVLLRPAPVRPADADTLRLAVLFGDEPHVLGLARTPRHPELDALWNTRADVPAPILLALAERECGPLFQLLENAIRRQLRLSGLADDAAAADSDLALQVADIPFTLTRTPTVETALGSTLRHLDPTHPAIRDMPLTAETEYASFALPATDLATLAPGDALLLPEIGTVPPRRIIDTRYILDDAGVTPYTEDTRCRVVAADPQTLTLGDLFDAAETPPPAPPPPTATAPLRLLQANKTLAQGHLETLGDAPAFIVESLSTPV
ncbi:MAG: hypothetical protein IKO01_03300 [Kiritimatiellae bacterium]|nr:hypothetical protein [Kiritimatiellia bacterium]